VTTATLVSPKTVLLKIDTSFVNGANFEKAIELERLSIVNSQQIVAIYTNSTEIESESVLKFTLSSAYLDGAVQIEANFEAISCELDKVVSVDGKPSVSHWEVIVHHNDAILFSEEMAVSEFIVILQVSDQDDSF
jgi:hypothetical protein